MTNDEDINGDKLSLQCIKKIQLDEKISLFNIFTMFSNLAFYHATILQSFTKNT